MVEVGGAGFALLFLGGIRYEIPTSKECQLRADEIDSITFLLNTQNLPTHGKNIFHSHWPMIYYQTRTFVKCLVITISLISL